MRTAGQGPGGFEKRDGFMRPGQDLVMAGYAGFTGTVKIGGISLKRAFRLCS